MAWSGSPITAVEARVDHRTIGIATIPRGGEVDRGVGRGEPVVEIVSQAPTTNNISYSASTVISSGGEPSESIRCRHPEAGRTRVVDGLDDSVVVEVRYGVVHRPEVIV